MVIRNLVFQGGGVKGMAYVGAIEVLEQRGLMGDITRAAGTSAGAITAALLAVGATSQDLDRILGGTSFSSFKDGKGWVLRKTDRLISNYGLYHGDVFHDWLKQHIAALTERATGRAQPDLTFQQLRALSEEQPGVFRDLYTVATNLTRQVPQVFSADTTPDVAVSIAVRMSMSIPLFFEAVSFGGDIYVDGGVSWNYPIDLFNALDEGAESTLGFCLGTAAQLASERQDWQPLPVKIADFEGLVKALVGFMLGESTRLHLDAAAIARTVFVDNFGIRTTDFDLTPDQIKQPCANGRAATIAWLDGAPR